MKIDRLDVCHETIAEESCESLVVSIKTISDNKFETRFNLDYKDEVSTIMMYCVEEMKKEKKLESFFNSNRFILAIRR